MESQATRTAFSKRLLDLVIVAPLALLISPFALVVAALIKLRDRGPIFYRAQRVGRGGEQFTMLKFRTMVVDAEAVGGSSTSAKDPRITPVGHTLRRWKLDELPQLINVLKGDMSLVGPRPQVGWDVDRYTEDERRLLTVRPGITDWASIKFRDEGEILAAEADPDEAYDRLIRPDKIRLGLEYVEHVSVKTDLGILRDTLKVVIGHEPHIPGDDEAGDVPDFSLITEDWSTLANTQQWELARQRYSLTAKLAEGRDLVEVGCGTGYGLAAVAPFTKSALGVELDDRNLAIARANAPQCEFVKGSAEELPLDDDSADCIAALEMYYYLSDQKKFLAEASRVLRPGGTLLITMPNPERKAFQTSPFSTHYPRAAELASLIEMAGFTVEQYGSCPVHEGSKAKEFLRRTLVFMRLIPRTIEGRARLKRLMFSDMLEIQTIAVNPASGFDHQVPLKASGPGNDFAITATVGRLATR